MKFYEDEHHKALDNLTKDLQQRKLQKQIIAGLVAGHVYFAALNAFCGLPVNSRELDRELQRMRRRGDLTFDRQSGSWWFTPYFVEQHPELGRND